MTYSESAKDKVITYKRALQELKNHGCILDNITLNEFHAECGMKDIYLATDILNFLGY